MYTIKPQLSQFTKLSINKENREPLMEVSFTKYICKCWGGGREKNKMNIIKKGDFGQKK